MFEGWLGSEGSVGVLRWVVYSCLGSVEGYMGSILSASLSKLGMSLSKGSDLGLLDKGC